MRVLLQYFSSLFNFLIWGSSMLHLPVVAYYGIRRAFAMRLFWWVLRFTFRRRLVVLTTVAWFAAILCIIIFTIISNRTSSLPSLVVFQQVFLLFDFIFRRILLLFQWFLLLEFTRSRIDLVLINYLVTVIEKRIWIYNFHLILTIAIHVLIVVRVANLLNLLLITPVF